MDAHPMQGPSRENLRAMVRQLVPGLALPGLTYYALAAHLGTMGALAAASAVPALDSVLRVARGKRPTFVGTAFLAVTGVSIGLATWLHEPWFILGKGAAISLVLGMALVLSAALDRPLTRTVAVRLLSDDAESRRRLAQRWSRPQAVAVFRHLALGWGLWLLASSLQQGAMVMIVSPGMFMAVEPPVRAVLTGLGILGSLAYVRRRQRSDPELGLLPTRAA